MEKHTLEPFYNQDAKILILGSFPSVKSREVGFYYSHPQNRFWKVLAGVFKEALPITINDKKELLKRNKIALYDVCASCDISASSDASIKNVIPNNLDEIFNVADIKVIVFVGKTAFNLYQKYFKDKYKLELICLPSTSPANATWNMDKLLKEYNILKNY